jgi:hypothetical protein
VTWGDGAALGGTRTPSLQIRRVCHRRCLPGRWCLTCSNASHWLASLLSVTRCCPARIRPALPHLPLRLSMRTIGRVVIHGRSRKCLARIGLPEVVLRRGGCCILVLHVSVIRDQVVIVKPVIGLLGLTASVEVAHIRAARCGSGLPVAGWLSYRVCAEFSWGASRESSCWQLVPAPPTVWESAGLVCAAVVWRRAGANVRVSLSSAG